MNSLRNTIEKLRNYITTNYSGKYRYFFEFEDQLDPLSTKHDIFPIIFVSPDTSFNITNDTGYFGTEMTFNIKVLDRINTDRTNIFTIMEETSNIINDIIIFFKNNGLSLTDDFQLIEPINNATTDNLAGYNLNVTFLIDSKAKCYYPIEVCAPGKLRLKNSINIWHKTLFIDSGDSDIYTLDDENYEIIYGNQTQTITWVPYSGQDINI